MYRTTSELLSINQDHKPKYLDHSPAIMKTTLLASFFAFAALALATPAPQEISTQGIDTTALKKGPKEPSSWKGLDDPQARSVCNAWRNIYGKGTKYKDTCNSILTNDFEAYSCSTQTTWGKRVCNSIL